MSEVVVFGGAGFIGSYVVDQLVDRDYKVIVADKKEPEYFSSEVRFEFCDILNFAETQKIAKKGEIIFNFAGLSDIDESIKKPKETIEQNLIVNINILEASKNLGVERYVFASSAYASSDKGSFYGISKLASEKVVEEYSKIYNLAYTVIRYGSVYGERADSRNGIYRLLRSAIETGAVNDFGEENEVREYIHAKDAAKMTIDVIESLDFRNDTVILTGVARLRKREIIRIVEEILNKKINLSSSTKQRGGHYQVTPYSYNPSIARKLVSNTYIDLGQGLLSCIDAISGKIEKEHVDS